MNRYRKLAAEFYYKRPAGVVLDWIENGVDGGVDEDVVELAAYLEKHFGPHVAEEDWQERLQAMASDKQQTWDLSPNDVAAIREALAELAALRNARDEFRSRLVTAERAAREWEGNAEAAESALRIAAELLRECIGDADTDGLYAMGNQVGEVRGCCGAVIERAADIERRIREWLSHV